MFDIAERLRVYIQPKPTVCGSVLVIVEKHPFLPKTASAIELPVSSVDTLVLVGGGTVKKRRM